MRMRDATLISFIMLNSISALDSWCRDSPNVVHFICRDSTYIVHFKCRDSPKVVRFICGTVPTLCILNVGTVPTLCILNEGTVPTISPSGMVPPQWPPQPCRQRAQRRRDLKIVAQKAAAAAKTGVEFCQGFNGTIRSSLATSYDAVQYRATSLKFFCHRLTNSQMKPGIEIVPT